ncbi:MAG: alpha/beta hydrolase [Flavobacteriaceae bacterium]|nr:alpha/beta hydrolase [Flavobacteriaceae bacterium]
MAKYIKYKNINIHYSDSGEGKPIVLLHGFLENLKMWDELSKVLQSKCRVISIDLLGHGQTECLGYIHTMEEMAEAVKSVLNHLNLTQYCLIGHSMGGYVALTICEKYGDEIIGLCLANSTSQSDSEERKLNRDRAVEAVKMNPKTFINVLISNLFRPKNRTLFSEEIKALKEEAYKMKVQGIIAAIEGMKIRKNREEVLKNSPFNKMMIIGTKDPILNPDHLLNEIKNTDVVCVELADGHMSYIENKEEFTYNIMHFIEKL